MALILDTLDAIKLREHLKVVLSAGQHEVVFKKKNGDIRVLKGTRDPGIIGQELFEKWTKPAPNKDGEQRVESTTSLPTFDVEAGAWRSFAFDALIGVDGINIDTILVNAQINLEG